jgi:hypothetical protein
VSAGETPLGLAAYLVASARDTLESPPVYGAFRLVEAASRLVDLAGADDAFLLATKAEIDAQKAVMVVEREQFAAWLDGLLVSLAREVKQRNRSP